MQPNEIIEVFGVQTTYRAWAHAKQLVAGWEVAQNAAEEKQRLSLNHLVAMAWQLGFEAANKSPIAKLDKIDQAVIENIQDQLGHMLSRSRI